MSRLKNRFKNRIGILSANDGKVLYQANYNARWFQSSVVAILARNEIKRYKKIKRLTVAPESQV